MPIYENGPVQIHYEEAGSGFPTESDPISLDTELV